MHEIESKHSRWRAFEWGRFAKPVNHFTRLLFVRYASAFSLAPTFIKRQIVYCYGL